MPTNLEHRFRTFEELGAALHIPSGLGKIHDVQRTEDVSSFACSMNNEGVRVSQGDEAVGTGRVEVARVACTVASVGNSEQFTSSFTCFKSLLW